MTIELKVLIVLSVASVALIFYMLFDVYKIKHPDIKHPKKDNTPSIKVIAVDFDGCLCTNNYPLAGKPNWDVINELKLEMNKGAKVILWTCRCGKDLKIAIDACKSWGLEFDAVNDNIKEWKKAWGNNTRKVGATEYWDDKAVRKGN